jgi:hypothetical protein
MAFPAFLVGVGFLWARVTTRPRADFLRLSGVGNRDASRTPEETGFEEYPSLIQKNAARTLSITHKSCRI